jgi:hypothetical protein
VVDAVCNRELDVIVEDERFAQQMEEMFLRDLENSTGTSLRSDRASGPVEQRAGKPGGEHGNRSADYSRPPWKAGGSVTMCVVVRDRSMRVENCSGAYPSACTSMRWTPVLRFACREAPSKSTVCPA